MNKELLDQPSIPFEDIRRNMQELETINRHLGGHAITRQGVKAFLPAKNLTILEIGCGGGDNLRTIQSCANSSGLQVKLCGVDINPECISYARSVQENAGIEFISSDYRNYTPLQKPDIIFSSLFCHHFTDAELAFMLRWMKNHSNRGFFINDLHRHPLAYYSIQLLTKLFSHSYLVKHDAPLSVLRGFHRREWHHLFREAGIPNFNCRWKWAFRWLISYQHDPCKTM